MLKPETTLLTFLLAAILVKLSRVHPCNLSATTKAFSEERAQPSSFDIFGKSNIWIHFNTFSCSMQLAQKTLCTDKALDPDSPAPLLPGSAASILRLQNSPA